MSYSISRTQSAPMMYATVLHDYHTESTYNPVTNTMATLSTLPVQLAALQAATAMSYSVPESLTCANQNPQYVCKSETDCPGDRSSCGACINNKCQK